MKHCIGIHECGEESGQIVYNVRERLYAYALRITHVFDKKSIETYIFPDLGDQEALLMSSERFLRPIFSMIGWPFCRQTHSSGLFLDPEHYL